MEKGEKVLFLEPHWKTMTETLTAWSLKSHQYVRLQVRPYNILHVQDPCCNDSEGHKSRELLRVATMCMRWVAQDSTTGNIRVEKGRQLVFPEPFEVSAAAQACSQRKYRAGTCTTPQSLRLSSVTRPSPFCVQVLVDKGIMDAIDLKSWEYVKIQDRTSGRVSMRGCSYP